MTAVYLDFERFFNLSPDLLCIAGFDGYFKKINPSVSRLLGYSEDELYARPINDFVHEEDKRMTSEARYNLTKKSHPLRNFENRYVTKRGEIVWLAWTSEPVESDQLVFAIAKDVTHKKELEATRIDLLESLTRVNSELKQFTLAASHDLRSPLSTLVMAFEMLDVSRIDDSETKNVLDILKSTGFTLETTLNKYVDALGAAMSGQSRLEDVDLGESLTDVLQSINPLITRSNAVVRADFSAFSTVCFDRSRMDSILLNLVTNSIRYSKPDVAPIMSIRSEITDGVKRLVVADNGLGIDMEKAADKIFRINQTFHNHRDSKGVGLYLVHSHVKSLGGEISVDSKVDEGTRFTISFKDRPRPVAAGAAASLPSRQSEVSAQRSCQGM